MDYYYEFELHKGTDFLSDELSKPPLHTQRFESEDELIEVFRQNGKRYHDWKIIPRVLRYDKKKRFVVVLEKGFDKGYEYYKFCGDEALEILKGNSMLWLHHDSGQAESAPLIPGFRLRYALADYTQYYSRPWDRYDSEERVQELVTEAKSFMDNLIGKYGISDFNPRIYRKHSSADWCDSFMNAVRESLDEQVF